MRCEKASASLVGAVAGCGSLEHADSASVSAVVEAVSVFIINPLAKGEECLALKSLLRVKLMTRPQFTTRLIGNAIARA